MSDLSPQPPPLPHGPDFSTIDSKAKAEEAFYAGQLEKLFLMPLEFGGMDGALNVLYVPIGAAAAKAHIDLNVIRPMAQQGKISHYQAKPEYEGKSVIPIAIRITASNPGSYSTVINIWGSALSGTA